MLDQVLQSLLSKGYGLNAYAQCSGKCFTSLSDTTYVIMDTCCTGAGLEGCLEHIAGDNDNDEGDSGWPSNDDNDNAGQLLYARVLTVPLQQVECA